MKIVVDWFVLCERVVRDAESNTLTLVACVDQVNTLEVPALKPGFAFAARCRTAAAPPEEPIDVEYRLIRYSDQDEEGEVVRLKGPWPAGVTRTRVYVNFPMGLQLKRQETIWFRLDHRLPGKRWRKGPAIPLDVALMNLPPEHESKIRDQLSALRDRGMVAPRATEPR